MSILTIFLAIFLTYPGVMPLLYPGMYVRKVGLNVNELLQNFKGASFLKDVFGGAYQASLVTILNYFALETGSRIRTFVVSVIALLVMSKHVQYAN